MNKNVLLCGVGGQGTILASKLIASAAMKTDIPVMTAETIGMSQRGGSVTSHIRMGDKLYSPLIGKGTADIILAFEPGEAVRNLPYLKKDGVVIVNTRPVRPVTATLSGADYTGMEMIDYLKGKGVNVITVDSTKAAEDLGSAKVLNVVLIGAALSKNVLPISKADMEEVILEKVPQKFHELNQKALHYTESSQGEI